MLQYGFGELELSERLVGASRAPHRQHGLGREGEGGGGGGGEERA